jgi:hypothetical protein
VRSANQSVVLESVESSAVGAMQGETWIGLAWKVPVPTKWSVVLYDINTISTTPSYVHTPPRPSVSKGRKCFLQFEAFKVRSVVSSMTKGSVAVQL